MTSRRLKWIVSQSSAPLLPNDTKSLAGAAGIASQASVPPRTTKSAYAIGKQRPYLGVRAKYSVALALSGLWLALSSWLAVPWMHDLGLLAGNILAIVIVAGIALVPGFMNAFLVVSLILDRRPLRRRLRHYPGVTILIAA